MRVFANEFSEVLTLHKRYYERIDGRTIDITGEIPFDLPRGWAWCRITNIGIINPRNHVSDDTLVSFMPMAQLEGGYGSSYTLSEKAWKDVKIGFTHFQENDVVFAKITPCFQNRKSAVMHGLKNGYGAGTTELHVIRCFSTIIPEHVLWFVKNQNFISDAVSTIQGVVGQQRIDANFIKDYFIPLPPLAEQARIVAQIESLLKCVDEIDRESETLEKALTLAKQKILDLAIRGKLVPQDPKDEPASELLKRIKTEKEALIKAGKLKRDKHESFIFRGDDNCYHENIDGKTADITEEIPFDLPQGWEWCRVKSFADVTTGATPRTNIKSFYGGGILFVKPPDLGFNKYIEGTAETLTEQGAQKSRMIPAGSICVCCIGSLGKSSIASGSVCTNQQINSLTTVANSEYVYYLCNSTYFINSLHSVATAITIALVNKSNMERILIPLPPLAEQKRIVSQVEKLFSVLETMRG